MAHYRPFTVDDVGTLLTLQIQPMEEVDSYRDTYADDPDLIAAFARAEAVCALWGWCCVRVKVCVPDTALFGDAYLGECSYASEKDFIETSGYYDQMVQDAVTDLNDKINLLLKKLPRA